MINATACTVTINLNNWHHGIHQVTGDMALRFNKATTADLERWAEILREAAEEMAAASKS
jgi:hypothetical protein